MQSCRNDATSSHLGITVAEALEIVHTLEAPVLATSEVADIVEAVQLLQVCFIRALVHLTMYHGRKG